MRVIGDIDRERVYTLAELEKKERLESVLAAECDLVNILKMDVQDKKLQKYHIAKVQRKRRNTCTKKQCTCIIKPQKQKKYIALKDLIAYTYGMCDLDRSQIGSMIPRTSALGCEYRILLLLIRQIVLSKEEGSSTPITFFIIWITINVLLVPFMYYDRTRM